MPLMSTRKMPATFSLDAVFITFAAVIRWRPTPEPCHQSCQHCARRTPIVAIRPSLIVRLVVAKREGVRNQLNLIFRALAFALRPTPVAGGSCSRHRRGFAHTYRAVELPVIGTRIPLETLPLPALDGVFRKRRRKPDPKSPCHAVQRSRSPPMPDATRRFRGPA